MSLNVPELLKGVIAESGDYNNIPLNATTAGAADYTKGFPPITQLPLASGGIEPDRWDFNGLFNILSQHAFWQQSGGLYTWSSSLDYLVPAMVVGSDGDLYRSLLASGPSGVGAKDPISNPTYWSNVINVITVADASETVSGILKLATQEQVTAGTDDTTAVTPAKLAARIVTTESDPTYVDSNTAPASTGWVRAAMSAIATAAGFAVLLASIGYIKFPNWLGGFILEWGTTGNMGANTSLVVTLPLAFTTAAFGAQVSGVNSASTSAYDNGPQVVSISETTLTIFMHDTTSNNSAMPAMWFAYGR